MGFNLDSVDTGAKVVNGVPTVSPSDPNYFSKYTVVIGPGERQVFNIRTVTNKWACSFLYSATILDGTRKVYQEIGDGERPFRISSLATGTQQQPFSGYAVAYVGGPTNTGTVGPYIRVNPRRHIGKDARPTRTRPAQAHIATWQMMSTSDCGPYVDQCRHGR